MAIQKENLISSCEKCGAVCCKHVALEIDKPTTKQDFDHIRWYLLHQNIEVFIEDDGKWYLKFETPCLRLNKNGSCGAYNERPVICRGYPPEDGECEYEGADTYYKHRFCSAEEFEAFMDAKKKNWRFKN
jgi:uncharacterized protein